MHSLPEGIFAAILTPFYDDERINFDQMRRHVERMIDGGVHAIFCLGSNGEFFALDFDEKIAVMRAMSAYASGRIPVYAGAGCITTGETIKLAAEAKACGINALSIIAPYYATLSQDQLYGHYLEVAGSTDLPIILYNMPSRTGNHIEPETLGRLSRIENIAAIKDSSGDQSNLEAYIDRTPDDFAVFSGSDILVLDGLRRGTSGSISGMANIVPEIVVGIYESWKDGSTDEAEAFQRRLNEACGILSLGHPDSGAIIKRATNLMGYPLGPCRKPLRLRDSVLDAKIKEVLSDCGVLRVSE